MYPTVSRTEQQFAYQRDAYEDQSLLKVNHLGKRTVPCNKTHLQLRHVPVLYLRVWRIIRPCHINPFDYEQIGMNK